MPFFGRMNLFQINRKFSARHIGQSCIKRPNLVQNRIAWPAKEKWEFMLTRNCIFKNSARFFGFALVFICAEFAHAGWTGGMNGTGYGWAGVNVVSSTKATNSARTPNLSLPSAAITPFGYKTNAALPSGASLNTYTRTKGNVGYVWQAATSGSTGDSTDNVEIEKRVAIKPANCTLLTMDSQLRSFDPESGSGSFAVKTLGTAGTALLLRGFEVSDVNTIPQDDPATPEDESIEYLKNNAALKFENLILGPFEYGFNGQCELIIHFTLNEPNLDNFIVTSDGVAKSNPITVTCPAPMTVQCGSQFVYPAVEVNTCREVTLTYEPSESELHPGMNLITVTATDDLGDSGSCTFVVNVVDSAPPVVPVLADVIRSCGSAVTLTAPIATDGCSGNITGTTSTTFPITQAGTTIVQWTFTDSKGNSATASQKVIIQGYEFVGFYAPIGTVGGTCSSPVKDINVGSKTPIKFDFKCGASSIITGTPPVVKIQRWSNSCGLLSEPISISAEYQNDWHINWDSTGWQKGIYKVIAVLPDGTSYFVFVRLVGK
jgi:hypothetical protein